MFVSLARITPTIHSRFDIRYSAFKLRVNPGKQPISTPGFSHRIELVQFLQRGNQCVTVNINDTRWGSKYQLVLHCLEKYCTLHSKKWHYETATIFGMLDFIDRERLPHSNLLEVDKVQRLCRVAVTKQLCIEQQRKVLRCA